MKPWSDSEWKSVQDLLEQGHSASVIAQMIGRSDCQVRGKLHWERMSIEKRQERAAQLRARRNAAAKEMFKSPRECRPEASGPKPAIETLDERNRRYAAPYRDAAGMLFGDPRVGFSALERRA